MKNEMILCGDTEDDHSTRNALRTLTVGDAVIEAAQDDPAVWEWLEALLNRTVTDSDDRDMLQLAPPEPPAPHLPLKLIK